MTEEHEKKPNVREEMGWLRRKIIDGRKQKQGDTVAANIGEGARGVAVGKNIIQIGTLKVPIWIVGIIALSFVVGVVAVVYDAFNTRTQLDATQEQVGEISVHVRATATPMPTPTMTPTPTPQPMDGDFNIAIAEPVLLQQANDPQIDKFIDWYPDKLKTQLEQDFEKYRTSLGLEPNIRIVPITIDNLDARHQYYADYAQRIGAHVMLYGLLDLTPNPGQFRPEFYVHPKLKSGAAETTGPDAFGDPIDILLSESGADQLAWKVDLNTPIADLSAFMTGLGFFDAGEYDLSREQFEKLHYSNGWATEEGKAILYLWLGTTHFFNALEQQDRGLDPEEVRCLASGEQVTESECAKQSYELAVRLKPDYPRAYIGLGSYWLDFADVFGCDRFDEAIEEYEMARAKADAATDYDAQFVETSLSTMKTLYQLGLTHARALREGCPDIETHDEKAVVYLQEAMGRYNQGDDESRLTNSMLRDLASRSSYMLGLVHKWLNRDEQALEALNQAIEIATPSNDLEDPWQSIRWVAKNQIGAIYLAQVEAGNYDAFEQARDVLHEVTKAYEEEQFGGSFDDEAVAASAAYYHLGRLYLAMAQRDEDAIDVSSLQEAEYVLNQSTEVLKDMDPAIVENLRDGLPWISYVELGHVYRLWADAGDTFRQEDALTNYQLVFDAFDAGRIVDGQVAIDVFAEAAYGAGAIYVVQGEYNEAVERLEQAIAAGKSKPTLVEAAKRLLEEIPEQTSIGGMNRPNPNAKAIL